ncbi:hypothetical protein B4U37_10370 [Sutcliffiella horikoshii]|uniref:Uncharacterized protein n=1 Tax=Sutcliffiella horikoshii TaxID=79883 RepID=A0ABN4ZDN2_9BACI|nr:hypothetical protein B4U37_10370 [Sutcliffiella horikoshii]
MEDPAGRMPEEASGPPMESEAPGTKINCLCEFYIFVKKHGSFIPCFFYRLLHIVIFSKNRHISRLACIQ